MDRSRREVKLGRVLPRGPSLCCAKNERMETISEMGTQLHQEKSQLSTSYSPLEIPRSPLKAMEFLSRTWSPSSSDFFQIFSSNKLLRLEDQANTCDEALEQDGDQNKTSRSAESGMRADQILTLLASGDLVELPSHRHKSSHSNWMHLSQMKTWLGGELLGSLSRGGRKRRKEETRLHAAQVHAALSVTRLASAVAGILSNCMLEPIDPHSTAMNFTGDWDPKMGTVVASAAALVATVCAEAAEFVGVSRAHVASAITTGLATRTSADMVSLTATAATCLRGVAALELRAVEANMHVSEDQRILARGTQLTIRMPKGDVHVRHVSIYIKHEKLILRLGKKHIRGIISSNREYRIFEAMKDSTEGGFCKDGRGFYLITLGTSGGTIQLLFQDQKQHRIWSSIISHAFCDC